MNPLRLAHHTLWWLLEQDEEFLRLVPVRSRVKQMAYYVPEISLSPAEADLPRVMVVNTAHKFALPAATNVTLVQSDWNILIEVGGASMDDVLDMIWAIVRAMTRAILIELPDSVYSVQLLNTEVKEERVVGRLATLSVCSVSVGVERPLDDVMGIPVGVP